MTRSGPGSPAKEAPAAPKPFARIPNLPGSWCVHLRLQGRYGGTPSRGALRTEGEGGSTGGPRSRAGAGQATSWAEPILPHDRGGGLAAGGTAEGLEEVGGCLRARSPCSPLRGRAGHQGGAVPPHLLSHWVGGHRQGLATKQSPCPERTRGDKGHPLGARPAPSLLRRHITSMGRGPLVLLPLALQEPLQGVLVHRVPHAGLGPACLDL